MKRKIPVVTFVILALNVIGLIYEYSVGEQMAVLKYGMYQGALEDGEYLRLLVSGFLHFGLYHFGSNMICLVLYGFDLEVKVGSGRYALIYFIALLGSSLLINFTGGNGIHAGASGAIWGLAHDRHPDLQCPSRPQCRLCAARNRAEPDLQFQRQCFLAGAYRRGRFRPDRRRRAVREQGTVGLIRAVISAVLVLGYSLLFMVPSRLPAEFSS